MVNDLFIFAVSLFFVVRGATISTKYAARLAGGFNLSKYTVGFIVIAVISILPEAFIAINSALEGAPAFGLGALFGSNVADLTLVFFIVILFAGRRIKIESKILQNNQFFPLLLLVPIALGGNGHFSRPEGIALVLVGAVFYFMAFRSGNGPALPASRGENRPKDLAFLLFGMVLLLGGAHFVVTSALDIAEGLGVNSLLIGMFLVGLGTVIPELSFSLKSVRKHEDGLAVGDVFGTVLADATIVVGILAIIAPFSFPSRIVYVTGLFMVGAAVILLQLMRSQRALTKGEAYLLFLYWIVFVLTEFLVNS